MIRFNKIELIGGGTLCILKHSKKGIVDTYLTNMCYEVMYLTIYFIHLKIIKNIFKANLKPATLKKLIMRDGGYCKSCGSNENLTVDHIIPISKGGSKTGYKNLQILCYECNQTKSNKIIE